MKKFLGVLVSIILLQAHAQQQPVLKNKRGILILPQRGDYCLGISANPFFSYIGNMFNGTTNNASPSFNTAGFNQTLFFKYMKTNTLAYRANFRIAVNNNAFTFDVADASPGAALNATVNDVTKFRNSNIGLSLGFEKRKGATRLQGFYGAEAYITFNSNKTIYEYGNKLEYLDTGLMRVKKVLSPNSFSIGCRAFAGVEYFIAPNFSIGGELGYGPSFLFASSGHQIVEQYDFTNAASVETKNQSYPARRGFTLDTDNYSGIIKVLFYF